MSITYLIHTTANTKDVATFSEFWRIPKGTKNIRVALPCAVYGSGWRDVLTDDEEKLANQRQLLLDQSGGMSLTQEQADELKKYEKQLALARVSTYASMCTFYPDSPLPKAYLDVKCPDGIDSPGAFSSMSWQIGHDAGGNSTYVAAPYCHDHNASIQVFHTDGKLLTGTPLHNWNLMRGELYGESSGWIKPDGSHTTGVTASSDSSKLALFWKCGLWAEWYARIYSQEINGGSFGGTAHPTPGTPVTPAQLTSKILTYSVHASDVFPSGFQFDDSMVNSNRQEVLKPDNTTLTTFSVEGETIRWSGNVGGASGVMSLTSRASYEELCGWYRSSTGEIIWLEPISYPYELLEIDEAQEDLIIGILGSDACVGYLQYGNTPATDPYEPNPPDEPSPIPEPPIVEPDPYYQPADDMCIGRPRAWRMRYKKFEAESDPDKPNPDPTPDPITSSPSMLTSSQLLNQIFNKSGRLPNIPKTQPVLDSTRIRTTTKSLVPNIYLNSDVGVTPKSGYYTPKRGVL